MAPGSLAVGFDMILFNLTILFGARYIVPREKHQDLVVAFESLVKLVALLSIGLFAIRVAFGGFLGVGKWLPDDPRALEEQT